MILSFETNKKLNEQTEKSISESLKLYFELAYHVHTAQVISSGIGITKL